MTRTMKTKPTRKTPRPSTPFGAGILPRFVPFYGRMPFTAAEYDAAGSILNADSDDDRDLDERALQARWDDQFDEPLPVDFCGSCGELAESLTGGLCPDCERRPEPCAMAC